MTGLRLPKADRPADAAPGRARDGGAGAAMMPTAALDRLMPMHLQLAADGTILHAGPTLCKIAPEARAGRPFDALVEVLRPRGVHDMAGLHAVEGGQLRLRLVGAEDVAMKGICVPLPGDGVLINLSFGYAVTAAVDRFHLTCGDFAITDLTIEMLYLIEAKSAAQEEQRKLNHRLSGAKQRAEAEALSDGLTGLANRRAFDAVLGRSLAHGAGFAVILIDLDYFKAVNDTLGHSAGDAVLINVAEVLQAQTRTGDLVARIGGDEFCILFPRLSDAAHLLDVATRIIGGLEEPMTFGDKVSRISGSIGVLVTEGVQEGRSAADIMRDADTAAYASKLRGRGQATLYDPSLDAEVAERIARAPAQAAGAR